MGRADRPFLIGALGAVLTGLLVPGPAASQAGAAAAQTPGMKVYEGACSRCHGQEGRSTTAPTLVPFLWNYSQALDIVRHGGPCGMPAFPESELSDEEVKQIVDYLKTFN